MGSSFGEVAKGRANIASDKLFSIVDDAKFLCVVNVSSWCLFCRYSKSLLSHWIACAMAWLNVERSNKVATGKCFNHQQVGLTVRWQLETIFNHHTSAIETLFGHQVLQIFILGNQIFGHLQLSKKAWSFNHPRRHDHWMAIETISNYRELNFERGHVIWFFQNLSTIFTCGN